MRTIIRGALVSQANRDRALFFLPIVIGLIVLALFAANKAALASVWRDPLSVLAQRSPGARDAGALYNTKIRPEVFKAALTGPHERVLPGLRERAEPPLSDPMLTDEPLSVLLDQEPDFGMTPFAFDGPNIPVTFGEDPPLVGGGGPSIGGVPEPSTWLMNILGLGLVGVLIRRRKMRAQALAAATVPSV